MTMEALIKIQSELKAPKNQMNSFGKYKYRSCEDILEALKPLLLKHGCTLTVTDEVKQVGDLIYIEATASIQKGEGGELLPLKLALIPIARAWIYRRPLAQLQAMPENIALTGFS